MACAHCCFSCRPGIGVDMSREVFLRAINLTHDRGDHFCLGGGEPTLHPDFWPFVTQALEYHEWSHREEVMLSGSGIPLLIITNGSQTKTALRLARLTREGTLEAVLSQDEWHDPIDKAVVVAFRDLQHRQGHEGVRSNTLITPHGSALKNGIHSNDEECCCEDLLISPKGTIWACGCRKVKFGTVFEPDVPDDWSRECGKNYAGEARA